MTECVGHRSLSIANDVGVVARTGHQGRRRDAADDLVVARHGRDDRLELEILDQDGRMARQRGVGVEVPGGEHEMGLHRGSRSFNWS